MIRRSRRSRRMGRRGVTLIELAVVIGIMAILIAMGIWVGRTSVGVWRDQADRVAAGHAAWGAVTQVTRDLTMAVSGAGLTLEGRQGSDTLEGVVPITLNEEVSKGKTVIRADVLRFGIPAASVHTGESSTVMVSYSIVKDPQGKLKGLARCVKEPSETWEQAAQNQQIVPDHGGDHVAELALRFLKRDPRRTTWVDSWSDANALPEAVQVTVGSWERDGVGGVRLVRCSSVAVLREGTRIGP